MPYKSFWRDFADGFLSTADMISVYRYQIGETDPRIWADYKRTTSPGVRAIQSYALRDACALGDTGFVPDSRSVKAVKRELKPEYGFGSDGFLMGQGFGNFAAGASVGVVPIVFYLFSKWEKTRERRIGKHFKNLLREIHSV